MTTFTITTDGDDITLWRTPGTAFGPEALLRQPAVHPDVWAMVALVVELGGPERVRAGVELAEATDRVNDCLFADAYVVESHQYGLKDALARFREVGTR